MMNRLLTVLFVMAVGGNPIIVPIEDDLDSASFSVANFGPYDKYQADTLLSYSISVNFSSSKNVYEIFRFGPDNNPSFKTVTKPYHAMLKTNAYSSTVLLPTSTCLGPNGMRLTVEIYRYDNNKLLFSDHFTIYPMDRSTINPTQYGENEIYTPNPAKGTYFLGAKYVTESFSFTNMLDYFLTDVYYQLPINQFKITRTTPIKDLSVGSANMIIEGNQSLFPALSYSDNKTYVPLKANISNDVVTLSYKSTMYVDPVFLHMSLTPRSGYVATNNFYLPVNHLKDLDGFSFTFEITEVGYAKTNFVWQSSLLVNNGILGDCNNNEYCVVGEVSG